MKHNAILIISPAWVGDIVMAQSLLKILKREHRDIYIDVLAPQWSEEFLKHIPEIRHIIPHTLAHGKLDLKTRYRIGESLRNQYYQQAIVLPNSWKSALIPFWANIPHRTGYVGEFRYGLLNDVRKLDTLRLRRTVDRFAALGFPNRDPKAEKAIPHPLLSTRHIEFAVQHFELSPSTKPILALCPGAEYGMAKRWPLEYFAKVAQAKIAENWQVWLFGSENEKDICARIQKLTFNRSINLAGRTQLSEAVDLLSLATAVVSNDSGLMHVAAALDKPLIAIYGSSDPNFTPPLNPKSHILYLGLDCSPCFQRTCKHKHLNCLRDIKPEKVIEMLKV